MLRIDHSFYILFIHVTRLQFLSYSHERFEKMFCVIMTGASSTIAIKNGPSRKKKVCREKIYIVNLFVCPPALYISSCGLPQREVEKALQQRGSFHRPMIMCNAMQSHSAHHRITAPTSCTCDRQCNNCYQTSPHANSFFFLSKTEAHHVPCLS